MGESVLVDAGYIVALLSRRDAHHDWAAAQAAERGPPWRTCEAALSEAFHLLGAPNAPAVCALLSRGALLVGFDLADELEAVLKLMRKYADVPISLADACLVRMTETSTAPLLLTTDSDFRIYRRHGRNVVPCVSPP
jgi:predicted nucleic acid-binding protein